jgi:hypothetical protein
MEMSVTDAAAFFTEPAIARILKRLGDAGFGSKPAARTASRCV